MMAEETKIEKSIKHFVLRRTGDDVYLDLPKSDCICVRHKSKRGSVVLATMWVNVLQHNNNFPVNRFPYSKLYDDKGNYKLVLRVDGITLTVFMTTGTLVMEGSFILQWFTQKFENILIAFSLPKQEPHPLNDEFCKNIAAWSEMNNRRKVIEEQKRQKQKEKEDKALIIEPLNIENSKEKEVEEGKTNESDEKGDKCGEEGETKDSDEKGDESGERETKESDEKGDTCNEKGEKCGEETENQIVGNVAAEELDTVSIDMLTGDSLQQQLEELHTGSVKDGPTYVFKIWKSLLNKWFSEEDCHVFMASPFLDADHLEDVCQLFLKNRLTASLDALFVRRECDHNLNISDIKRETQGRFSPRDQVYIEYKLFNSIIYPLTPFHTKFIACVKDGHAQVLVTSANFHADHFVQPSAESIIYIDMSESEFSARFLKLISSSVSL